MKSLTGVKEGQVLTGCKIIPSGGTIELVVAEIISETSLEVTVTYQGVFMGRAIYTVGAPRLRWVS